MAMQPVRQRAGERAAAVAARVLSGLPDDSARGLAGVHGGADGGGRGVKRLFFVYWRWRTSQCDTWTHGRRFDLRKPWDVVRFNFWETIFAWGSAPANIRSWLACWLARAVCWLRGEQWYVADAWYGVPGNRAAEIRQQIRDELILNLDLNDEEEKEAFHRVERLSAELAQGAGESWGHVWPKEKRKT